MRKDLEIKIPSELEQNLSLLAAVHGKQDTAEFLLEHIRQMIENNLLIIGQTELEQSLTEELIRLVPVPIESRNKHNPVVYAHLQSSDEGWDCYVTAVETKDGRLQIHGYCNPGWVTAPLAQVIFLMKADKLSVSLNADFQPVSFSQLYEFLRKAG